MSRLIKCLTMAMALMMISSCVVFAEENEPDTVVRLNPSDSVVSTSRFIDKDFFDRQIKNIKAKQLRTDIKNGILILVNKSHALHTDYIPEDLSPIAYYAKDRLAETRFMRKEAADMFNLMVQSAQAEGIQIVMTTAYRSYSFQSVLFNGYVKSKGEAAALKTSARPGQSEHQSGLAVDLSSPVINYRLSYDFGDIEEGGWIRNNAHRFGFILRYAQGKEEITGYNYEPWHIRYVGKTAASDIYHESLALEEYIDQIEREGVFSDISNISILTF